MMSPNINNIDSSRTLAVVAVVFVCSERREHPAKVDEAATEGRSGLLVRSPAGRDLRATRHAVAAVRSASDMHFYS